MKTRLEPGTLVMMDHPWKQNNLETIGTVIGPAPGYDPEFYLILFEDRLKVMDMDFLMEVEWCTTYTPTKK